MFLQRGWSVQFFIAKLGMDDIYSWVWGGILSNNLHICITYNYYKNIWYNKIIKILEFEFEGWLNPQDRSFMLQLRHTQGWPQLRWLSYTPSHD